MRRTLQALAWGWVLVSCQGKLGLDDLNGDSGGEGATVEIQSVDPDWGPTEGGTIVTLLGTGFEGDMTVSFGRAEVDVTRVGPDEIIVASPALGFEGSVDLTVTSDLGEAVLENGYHYSDSGPPPDTGNDDTGGTSSTGGTGGYVELSFVQYACPSCFGLASDLSATAMAQFHTPVQDSWLSWLPATGTCIRDHTASTPSVTLDGVGDYVHLLAGQRTVGLQRIVDSTGTWYEGANLSAADFVSNTSYDLSVPGSGSTAAFQVEDVISTPQGWVSFAPQSLLMDTPYAYSAQVSRSTGISFSWSPSGGGEQVLVQMIFGDMSGQTLGTVVCHATNHGSLTVPSPVLSGLPTGSIAIVQIMRFVQSSSTRPDNGSALEGIALLGFVGTALVTP